MENEAQAARRNGIMPIDGIQQGQPVGDGQTGRPAWGPPGERRREAERRSLLAGLDRIDRSRPVEGALGLLHTSLLRAMREAFDGLEAPAAPLDASAYRPWTPETLADELAGRAGAYLKRAAEAGVEDAAERLRRSTRAAVDETLACLEELGLTAAEGGCAVFQTLDLWGARLAALAGESGAS